MRLTLPAIVLTAALASGAAAQDATAPAELTSRECGRLGPSINAAQAAYDALPEKIDDDQVAVDDAEFAKALADWSSQAEKLKVWRMKPPDYNEWALIEAREAACAAVFDVATSGRTINLAVSCTDARFEISVRRSVADMLFLPKRLNGAAVVARRVVQPISFCLDD